MTLQIDPKATFAGLPILQVRHAVRRVVYDGFDVGSFAQDLRTSPRVARRVITQLEAEGFIERAGLSKRLLWKLTDKGAKLAAGRATPRIYRSTADRLLAGLIDRMHQLESREDLLFRVEWAAVYGSYLRDVDRLGDLDIAVKLARKETDPARHRARTRAALAAASSSGRRFSGIADRIGYPRDEVCRFLRGRSRSISLYEIDEDSGSVLRDGSWQIYPPCEPNGRTVVSRQSRGRRLTVQRVEADGVINVDAWAQR